MYTFQFIVRNPDSKQVISPNCGSYYFISFYGISYNHLTVGVPAATDSTTHYCSYVDFVSSILAPQNTLITLDDPFSCHFVPSYFTNFNAILRGRDGFKADVSMKFR